MVLFITIIFFILTAAWFSYGFPRLISFTEVLAEWCQSLFLQCLEYFLIIKTFFLWFGFIVLSAWFAYAVFKAFFTLLKAARQIKKLPLSCHGDITVIKDDKLKTAFTHGLFQPKIYISAGLINSLDKSELKAVYLHELHHKNRKDPLRFFILSIAKDTFFYIPVKGFIERIIRTRIEAKADDAAVMEMKEPLSLAAALLKIAGFNKNMLMFQPASITGIGSVENRIKRLVEGKGEKIKLPSAKAIATSIFISGFLMLSLAFPLFASFPAHGRCDMEHCDVHKIKLGKGCHNHCEVQEHKH
ncbi:MAG: M56 family metallopeptidase [Deltaproteobacteria bacterium]|nr:M56 family metallopeptidase [Deltaproteobacteria bacterium]